MKALAFYASYFAGALGLRRCSESDEKTLCRGRIAMRANAYVGHHRKSAQQGQHKIFYRKVGMNIAGVCQEFEVLRVASDWVMHVAVGAVELFRIYYDFKLPAPSISHCAPRSILAVRI